MKDRSQSLMGQEMSGDAEGDVELIEDNSDGSENKDSGGPNKMIEAEAMYIKDHIDIDNYKKHMLATKRSDLKSTQTATTTTNVELKRSRNSIEDNEDKTVDGTKSHVDSISDGERAPFKKTKTEQMSADAADSQCKLETQSELINKRNLTNEIKEEDFEKTSVQLYPAPKFVEKVEPLKFEFLKHIPKSFDKLSRADLEELVLQKVVEAIEFKSEFADIREKLEKYENAISSYRKKVADLTNQFLDLERVHKRLVNDVEAKNYIGLQVGPPYKRVLEANMTQQPNGVSTQRGSPQAAIVPHSVITTMTPATSTKRDSSVIASSVAASATAAALNARRDCLQKVTPQRPVPSASSCSGMSGSMVTKAAAQAQTAQMKTPAKALIRNVTAARVATTCIVNMPNASFTNVALSGRLTSAKPNEETVIDLTDEDDAEALSRQQPNSNMKLQYLSITYPATSRFRYSHPAPLPVLPVQQSKPEWKLIPSRPTVRVRLLESGIYVSWTMDESTDRHAQCVSYQIYAYAETRQTPNTDLWQHVGDVNALPLPMAVTLNQFQENPRYYFAVRAVDEHRRLGPFSYPITWT